MLNKGYQQWDTCLLQKVWYGCDPSIAATDGSLLKAKGRVWHKSSMKKGVVYLFQASIPMQGGAIAIPKDGSSDINYIYTCTAGEVVSTL